MSVLSDVIRSLRENPHDWAYDFGHFRLVHKGGEVAVWIANSTYGLGIERNGRNIWGSVTFLSSFGLSIPHHRLAAAVRHWKRRELGTDEAAIKASLT